MAGYWNLLGQRGGSCLHSDIVPLAGRFCMTTLCFFTPLGLTSIPRLTEAIGKERLCNLHQTFPVNIKLGM